MPKRYPIPDFVKGLVGLEALEVFPIQVHGLGFGIFASLVAPFGGYLASAIKRAYKVKDFEQTIPGHGGVMDRMDCQLLMGLFTTVYLNAFVRCVHGAMDSALSGEGSSRALTPLPRMEMLSVGSMLNTISRLSRDDQAQLYRELRAKLKQEGVVVF